MSSGAIEDVYPAGPANVPADLTRPTAAYTRNAWLAVAALLAFVALYLGLTGWLGYTTYRLITQGATGSGDGAFTAWILAIPTGFLFFFLVKGLFYVKHAQDSLQIEVNESSEPTLFAFVNRIADEVGAPRPHRIFVSPRVNAAVFYDVSVLNLVWPTKKNLEIGLGLVNAITLDELKAVLAHEFGHFAQRSMAIGTWVYISAQVTGNLIAARDVFDRFLDGLSRSDFRIAWIGWLMRLIIWSIRGVLEIAFRGVIVVERALSRQMELQADLVSVSSCGSDSLVHALHRLQLADEAWGIAANLMVREASKGHRTADLFVLQSEIERRMADIRDEPEALRAPDVPDDAPHAHRVFEEDFAQPPAMWSTHPPSREREDNAKRRYIPSPRDEREPWILFADPERMRIDLTAKMLEEFEELPREPVRAQQSVETVQKEFGRAFLERRYLGTYLGRSVVQHVADPADLMDPPATEADRTALVARIDALYPEDLQADLQHWQGLCKEHSMLEALKDGILTVPGGVIRFQGREIPRSEIGAALDELERKRDAATAALCRHDREVRSAHRDAAATIGGPEWATYHERLVELLYFLEHGRAELEDVRSYVHHIIEIVTADGHVSGRERNRLAEAVLDAWTVLSEVFGRRGDVEFPVDVAAKTEHSFSGLLPDSFDLPVAGADNIDGEYLEALDAYLGATTAAFGRGATATLEVLVATEDRIATALRQNAPLGEAPKPAKVPERYHRRPEGSARPRQKRLGWWDRFMTADGWVPGLARLAVAVALLTAGVVALDSTGRVTAHVVNGLGIPVKVTLGGTSHVIDPMSVATVSPGNGTTVLAETKDGEQIERFEADLSNPWTAHIYNVARASPLVEWTAVYGNRNRPAPKRLGNPRWSTSGADHIFEEPPTTISSRGGAGRRTVLTGVFDAPIGGQLSVVQAPEAIDALALAHVRWDPTDHPNFLNWLTVADDASGLPQTLRIRLQEAPKDVPVNRALMDVDDAKEEACTNIERLKQAEPDDLDLAYLSIRCRPDSPQRDAAFMEGHRKAPEHGWFAVAAAAEFEEAGDWAAALKAMDTASAKLRGYEEAMALPTLRVRRMVDGAPTAPGPAVRQRLGVLAKVIELDIVPQAKLPDALRWHGALATGDLAVAQANADGDPVRLRLMGASDGATPEQTDAALALSADADGGIARDTILTAIALARRARVPDGALLQALDAFDEPEVTKAVAGPRPQRTRQGYPATRARDGWRSPLLAGATRRRRLRAARSRSTGPLALARPARALSVRAPLPRATQPVADHAGVSLGSPFMSSTPCSASERLTARRRQQSPAGPAY